MVKLLQCRSVLSQRTATIAWTAAANTHRISAALYAATWTVLFDGESDV
jgi:hypothetical protein